MNNLLIFLDGFLEYLICFGVFAAAILIAVFIGISMRKAKNAKEDKMTETETAEE